MLQQFFTNAYPGKCPGGKLLFIFALAISNAVF